MCVGSSSGLGRRLRVAGEERVDEHARVAVGQLEAGMSKEVDLHVQSPSVSFGFPSSRASCQPTATPTSMPMRVSSASSVSTRLTRGASSGSAAAERTSDWCAAPNQPPSFERVRQHALELRGRRGHQPLRAREALRVGQRPHGGVHLLVGEHQGGLVSRGSSRPISRARERAAHRRGDVRPTPS